MEFNNGVDLLTLVKSYSVSADSFFSQWNVLVLIQRKERNAQHNNARKIYHTTLHLAQGEGTKGRKFALVGCPAPSTGPGT